MTIGWAYNFDFVGPFFQTFFGELSKMRSEIEVVMALENISLMQVRILDGLCLGFYGCRKQRRLAVHGLLVLLRCR
jgi:hypothetical protein